VNNTTGNNLSDKHLVDKVMSGDTYAFGSVIKLTERLVAGIVFKMISNPEERKDIAQDIYLKAFKNISGFRFHAKLSTWIGQISYNTCLDHLRKKKLILPGNLHEESNGEDNVRDRIESGSRTLPGIETDTFVLQKDLSAILKKEIEKLSPVYKTLITLFHQEELSYEEIEKITGLPAGTVKSYLFRARKLLKNSLLINYNREEL
jgi:RNA polymerase sigma-70 factor (ECF subfamily)